jgi:ribulose-phosphate 3-epimerase
MKHDETDMRRLKLSASIICANLMNLGADFEILDHKGFDYLHFDMMDGHFVPEIGLGIFFLEQITSSQHLPVDVHLMVTDPQRYIEPLARAGAAMISIHFETDRDVTPVLRQISEHGIKTGLALKPDTTIASLIPYLDVLDLVLLMAYAPGIRNQAPSPGFEQKVHELAELLDAHGRSATDIAVDGGISVERMRMYRDFGANFFILGSSGLFIPNTRLSEQIDCVKKALSS